LRYNATRLFKDLRMLVLERDRTIEALETVKSAEQAGFVSLATKHHQQHFRDRLIESRVALDVRIDDVWYKLKNEDLKALSPGQKEWLFGCMTSTGLTFSDRRAEPPMRASPSPSSRWRFNSDYVHHDNGIRADDFSEACTHSLFDYPRKLAKLRQAFIGAVHEDTVEMLAANQAIENRTADWVYRSSNEDVAREFNRLAAALVDRVVPESSQRRSQSANSDRVDAEIIRMRRSLAQSYY
uniref:Uncharacterized protein n=1 Tax=Plectus sambesii TaxID=2011161 RepID=A0A914VM66_9BILA